MACLPHWKSKANWTPIHGDLNRTLITVCSIHTHTDYLLQSSPIDFLQHPVSVQTTLSSYVDFTCTSNVSIDQQWPYEPKLSPKLFWRFNGTSVQVNDMGEVLTYPAHWNVTSTEDSSYLRINNVSEYDMGYYECVVGDGLHTSETGFAYITVTRRAWLNVVGKLRVTVNSHWLPVFLHGLY